MTRTTIRTTNGFLIAVGLWLILAPLMMTFTTGALWNSIVLGVIVLVLGGVREWADSAPTAWANWLHIIAGLWLLAAPFVVGFSEYAGAFWSTFISGLAILILAGWGLSAPEISEAEIGHQL